MSKQEMIREAIRAERQRRIAEAARISVPARIAGGEEQQALDALLFFTPPAGFLARLDALEREIQGAFDAAPVELQARYLRFAAELTLSLHSFLPRWNLQDAAQHGQRALSDEQVAGAAERMRALAAALEQRSPVAAARWLAEQRMEVTRRLEAEAAADPSAEARALVGDSVEAYLANLSAQFTRSNLRRIADMRLAGEMCTEIGNDFAAFLPHARHLGACFVTCNPPLVERAWASAPERWTPAADRLILAHPQADADRLALLLTAEIVLEQMLLLRPIFLLSEGETGYVCLQVNPRKHGAAAAMIADARFIYGWLTERIGGTPNVVFKLPGTRAGLEACRALTRQGIGVTITVNFGLFQHLPFAEAIQQGDAPVSYLVEMNGRLAFPVRDELLARLDALADAGIGEAQAREAAAWAGVAVVKRLEKLLNERGYDRRRVKTLVASLRIYRGDGYERLPSSFPDITETLGAGVISIFPNIRRPFDAHAGLALAPRRIEQAAPERVMQVLAHSEIFKQAYYLAGDARFRPTDPFGLENEDRTLAWPPVRDTLAEFVKSYEAMVARIMERKQLLLSVGRSS